MACACGAKKGTTRKTYLYTSPTGEKKTYSSEVEARAAVAKKGGTYTVQG